MTTLRSQHGNRLKQSPWRFTIVSVPRVAMIAVLTATLTAGRAVALSSPQATMSAQVSAQALNVLVTDYWEYYLRRFPERATALRDKRYNDRWSDLSIAETERSLRWEQDHVRRLQAIDSARLSAQDKLSHDLLLHILLEDLESARLKEWEMPLHQIHGIHFELPQLVAVTPFDDVNDYDNYIARLRKVPRLFRELTANMKRGILDGRVPAKLVAEKVLAQVNSILDLPPQDSPFVAPMKQFPDNISAAEQKRISRDIEHAVSHDVIPAYRELARFLRTTYIPKSRSEPGVWSIPNGDAYYSFCVRRHTTLKLTAEQIHEIGLEQVRRDEADMLAIVQKLGFADRASFIAATASNPALHPASREQLLDAYRGYLNQIKAKLPELFGILPKAALIVEATPVYTEKQRPSATYEPGPPDGTRPGRVIANTYNFAHLSLGDVESIAYHEGIPGHHLQFSIAQERGDLPAFRMHTEYTAYTEGWGLYAEQLGKDVGFYQDPYSDYGRLQSDLLRSIRLVVDTGLHAKHWTRQQVVDYFHEHSSIDETNVQRETDRYIAWPGQALGYKIGQLELLKLLQRARKRLGARFDIKRFHDLILDSGALPLDVLNTYFDDWLAAQT
jgi:uncharacterized protein (DUF885 family)